MPLQTDCVYHDPRFLDEDDATAAFAQLLETTPFEKSAKINRWTALYELPSAGGGDADDKAGSYKYRDAPGASRIGFPPAVNQMKTKAEEWYSSKTGRSVNFNVCLLNYYEDGTQRIGWHSDREEIGRSTPIASISLGATRQFYVRSKTDGVRDRATLSLANGSLVVMENVCQMKYLHSVPKEGDVTEGRINLTFRCKSEGEGATAGELEHERRDHWITQISTEQGAFDTAASAWKEDQGVESNSVVFGDDAIFYDDANYSEGRVKQTLECVIKTNIGAESYCASEVNEVIDVERFHTLARPFGIAAYVAVCRRDAEDSVDADDRAKIHGSLLRLHSAHHVLQYHDHFELSDVVAFLELGATPPDDGEDAETRLGTNSVTGEQLYEYYKDRLVKGNACISTLKDLPDGGTFRTSCDRIGSGHAFNHPEVEREVGGAMVEYYEQIKPDMTNYDVHIRIDVVAKKVIVGTQINIDDISKGRHFLRFRNAVTIKSNLAYAMVRLANVPQGGLLCDPFCGSGTILLEAIDIYSKQIRCVGMDVSRRAVNGARENALAEGAGDNVCHFHCCDARNFRKHLTTESVDAIVSNLPWGIMTGSKNVSDLQTTYEVFLRTAWYVLKDGARIVMLVLRGLQLTRIIRKLSGRYRLLSVNCVRTTNNLPSIVVVEKLATDEVRVAVKRQLDYLSQFVSVSSEMYSAVHYEKIDETTT